MKHDVCIIAGFVVVVSLFGCAALVGVNGGQPAQPVQPVWQVEDRAFLADHCQYRGTVLAFGSNLEETEKDLKSLVRGMQGNVYDVIHARSVRIDAEVFYCPLSALKTIPDEGHE